ncbi:MAG: thiamine pyrophosphate-dependent dehydrogenase E1 component subunit alpha [candidate division Zixibacteria bacterium]|nr:thiamine pyrophosphate-dependent dehydrogenase E1 component subunit alpha [candidate division Zixibacteria bacterium]
MRKTTTKVSGLSRKAAEKVPEEDQRNLYYHLMKVRMFDERCRKLFKQGRFPGTYFSQVGQEATTVAPAYCLNDKDMVAPSHRDMGAIITKGMPLVELLRQVFARSTSPDKGKSHPCHFGYPELRCLTPASTVAGQIVVGTGAAMAFKIQKQPNVVYCGFGEGGTSRGGFHEALNFAGIHDLPAIYVCQNNLWAESVPAHLQSKIEKYSDRAKAYGFEGVTIDGNDILQVYLTAKKAVDKARNGDGPTFIECLTYRWYGHSEIDPANYRTNEELEYWKKRDPVALYEKYLEKSGVMKESDRKEVTDRIEAEIQESIETAEADPHPEADAALEDVYSFSPAPNFPRS